MPRLVEMRCVRRSTSKARVATTLLQRGSRISLAPGIERPQGRGGGLYKPVMVNEASALYIRHTIIPVSSRHVACVQRSPRRGLMFHVKRAKPRAQRVVLTALMGRLIFGESVRRLWRISVTTREQMFRTDTVRSCDEGQG